LPLLVLFVFLGIHAYIMNIVHIEQQQIQVLLKWIDRCSSHSSNKMELRPATINSMPIIILNCCKLFPKVFS
jgi:hypothetical protein